MRFAVVSARPTPTSTALAAAGWPHASSCVLAPDRALHELGPGDVALGRLDVRESLRGVEPGLWELGRLIDNGVMVLNRPAALLGAHDKLLTAALLGSAGVPHPRSRLVVAGAPVPELEPPLVLKPRFGSWGRDVELCRDEDELAAGLERISERPWFRSGGALLQELVPPLRRDLRLVVARGRVIGSIERHAAPGEWRTNVALGGRRVRAIPPPGAIRLALEAAAASGLDLVGVDLLPLERGGFVVLELNGAVDFSPDYAPGGNVFGAAIDALAGPKAGALPLAV